MTRRAKGEGSIFQQADGRWVGRIDVGADPRTGKRRRRKVTGTTKAQVSKRLREMRAEIDAGIDAIEQPTAAHDALVFRSEAGTPSLSQQLASGIHRL